jgi:pimeloyl-ACP methyl ester carboxylesterase
MLGGSYAISEYLYDIAQLLHQTQLTPIKIIGHSLGAAITLRYAGLYPKNVTKVVAIEGMGPAPHRRDDRKELTTQDQLHRWIDQLRDLSGRTPRRYATLEEAWNRMQEANPHLSPDQARHLTIHGVNQNEDGTYSWKFDNYIRATPPFTMPSAASAELWSAIECPTLLIHGADSWAVDPRSDGRAAHFRNVQVEEFKNAGHWVHHDQLAGFLKLVKKFLAD